MLTRVIYFLGVVLAASTASWAEEHTDDEGLDIAVNEGLLSVDLGEVSLGEVLQAIGEHAGFQVEVQGDLGSVRPQAFEGLPLEKGIRRLVGDSRVSLVMHYEVDETGNRRLAEVRAYDAGAVPAAWLERQRMLSSLRQVRPPPPPPPPALGRQTR